MRLLPVWALRPGMEVARKVYHGEGAPLLNAGVKLQMDYIQRLKKLNIRAVYIHDNLIPDIEVEDIILEETREKAISLARDTLTSFKNTETGKMSRFLSVKEDLGSVLDDIIGQLLNNSNLTVNLSDIRYTDDYTFSHSVNVAVFSIMTAIAMGMKKSELKTLGLGAFLHDLGKVLVPLSLLNKPGKLSEEEMIEIRRHPADGLNLVKARHLFNGQSLAIIYKHHERANGCGYPNGLKSEEIEIYPKICAVTDVYDALVSDRPYRKGFLPHKAMTIMDLESEGYDLQVLQKFYHNVSAYPIGTIVGLTNGLIGVVTHNTHGHTTRPRVRIICSKDDFEPLERYEIELADSLTVAVDHVYSENELPESVLNGKTS